MDYAAWLDLVSRTGVTVSNIDPGWLNTQFAAGQSPATVAQQIRTGSAPIVVVTQQVPSFPSQPMFTCRACGCHEFFYDLLPGKAAPSHSGAIILALLLSLGLMCLPFGIFIAMGLWLLIGIGMIFSQPKGTKNVARCKRCGWSSL